MKEFLLFKFTFALRGQQPDPEAAHPNPPSNSPLPNVTSPPAGQGQAANASAAPPQVPAPPSSAGAPRGTADGRQESTASTAPDSGSRETWGGEMIYHTGWVEAVAVIGAVLLAAGYIFTQAVKVFHTSL